MIRTKVLMSAVLGTLVYVAVSICLGPEGLWAAAQLEEQKQLIYSNVQKIQAINDDLSVTFLGLRVDKDVVASYAKNLGYVYDGEKIIRLSGLNTQPEFAPDTGIAISIGKIDFFPEWACKLSGIIVFIFFLLLFLTSRQKDEETENHLSKSDKTSGLSAYDNQ